MVMEDMIGDPDNASGYMAFDQTGCNVLIQIQGTSNLHQIKKRINGETNFQKRILLKIEKQ